MSTRSAWAATVLTVAVLTAGCGGSSGGDPKAHSATATPSPAASSPKAMLTPTAPARTPLGTGQRVWAAFSQRGLSYDRWWARLEPLLSDSARAVYQYDDPRNIPSMKLTGTIRMAAKPPGQARYTAEVLVPTSKGLFRLDLERHTLTSRWLLYAIDFPPGVQ
jgi:hypothetical protein